MSLFYGIVTGIIFGFLLQKAHVLRYDKQVGALRLLDMTIVKFMLSAIIVASAGIYLFKDLGMIQLSMKDLSIGAQVVGGILFGIGWGLLGYCPGTAAGALGEGRYDGLWGILGMLCGGGLFAVAYPITKTYIASMGSYGKIGLPQLLGLNHWIVILIFTVLCILLFRFFEKNNL
ncbi:MAG: YeeE/YedE thiosulfate transporter family protein [Desulfobacterales bacterium]